MKKLTIIDSYDNNELGAIVIKGNGDGLWALRETLNLILAGVQDHGIVEAGVEIEILKEDDDEVHQVSET